MQNLLIRFHSALSSSQAYMNIAGKTYREHAVNPAAPYAVYYEISDNRDSDLEQVSDTGIARIQLDVVANSAMASKQGCIEALNALNDSETKPVSTSLRAKGYDLETELYAHSIDFTFHY